MPTPTYRRDDAEIVVAAVNEALKKGYRPAGISGHGLGAKSAAADGMGRPRQTFCSQLDKAKDLYGLEPDWSLYTPPDNSTDIENAAPEKQRHIDRISELEGQLRDAHRRINHQDDIERHAMGLKDYPLDIPKWTLKKTKKKSGMMEAPILFTSDFQFGEVVDLDEMEGLNAYNVEIAVKRYKTLIDKTVSLCFEHTANPNFPGIIYLRGGDAISGAIHEELSETDEYRPPEAVVALARHEISGIEHLADRFGRVHVISVPGNHDRTTLKKRHKKVLAGSYELMLQAIIQVHFEARKDNRITFHTPKSGDAYFPVWGWQFLLTHGDRIGTGGGQGFIGPIATITRGFLKMRQQHAGFGKHLDFILTGHFHTSCEPPGGFGNGSLIGYNEFARDLRAFPEPPCQWLLMVHPEQGITQRRKIFVEQPKYDMGISTTWTAVPSR